MSDKEITIVKIFFNSLIYGHRSASPKRHGFDCIEKCVSVTNTCNSSKRRNTIINCLRCCNAELQKSCNLALQRYECFYNYL